MYNYIHDQINLDTKKPEVVEVTPTRKGWERFEAKRKTPTKEFRSCSSCVNEEISFNDALCAVCNSVYSNYVAKEDAINPSHYTEGGIETIDYIKAKSTPEEFRGFLKGNALKYISRAGKKDSIKQDIEKAIWYLTKWKSEV